MTAREIPILFSAPMVLALLAGTKTQTRRVIPFDCGWKRPAGTARAEVRLRPNGDAEWFWPEFPDFPPIVGRNRYGQPGDRLWVRETFLDLPDSGEPPMYRADAWADELVAKWRSDPAYPQVKWSPSIHMPRWASRITLEVESVRVERLQEISEEDSIAEGCTADPELPRCFAQARDTFRQLWDQINAPRGYGWDANPRVRVISFRRVQP